MHDIAGANIKANKMFNSNVVDFRLLYILGLGITPKIN